MPIFKIAESPMYYVDRGQGVPVVMLHSYIGNAFTWAPQIYEFEKHFRVIAPDLWGHGNSGVLPAGTHDLTALAHQMLALLDSLGIDKFILIGQSIGGMLAGEIAFIAPRRILAIALLNTYLGAEPEASKARFMGIIDEVEKSEIFSPASIALLEPLFFKSDDSEITLKLKKSFRHDLSAMTVNRIMESIIPIGRIIFNRRDIRQHLGELNPNLTIVICGQYDVARPPEESREMAQLIGCHCIEVPDVGHTASLEAPEFVTTVLMEFINRSLLNPTVKSCENNLNQTF